MALLPTEFSELRAVRREVVPGDRAGAVGDADVELDGGAAGVLRRDLPRVTDAIAFCDTFPFDDMPDDAVNLLRLVYSFVIVSFAVELWSQPDVPGTLGTSFDRVAEPRP